MLHIRCLIRTALTENDGMTKRQKQHTLPRFYLELFLPGWVYPRGKNAPHKRKSASAIMAQHDYYGKSGTVEEVLDNLNSAVENRVAPVYRKMLVEPLSITGHDWLILSYFFANIFLRTPTSIEEIRFMELQTAATALEMAIEMTKRMETNLLVDKRLSHLPLDVPDSDAPSMTVEEMLGHAEKLAAKNGHRTAALDSYDSLPDIAESIQNMSFRVVQAPPGLFFVTSDRALTLKRRTTNSRVGAGWARKDAMGLLSLSPRYFLILFYGEASGLHVATPDQVAGLNLETIMYANKEVYSPFEYQEAEDWMRGVGRWQ
jgi:hypothetical protein